LPGASGGSESSIEFFYLAQLTAWLYVQPGLLWIHTPGGGDPAPIDDATMLYLLVGVEF
jgi:carbohydrate-selective porin OprB